jgi:hypothetical protein
LKFLLFLRWFFLFAVVLTACKVKHVAQSDKEFLICQQLSGEIENTKIIAQHSGPVEQNIYSYSDKTIYTDIIKISESPKAIINNSSNKGEVLAGKKNTVRDGHSGIVKNFSSSSSNVDKDNIFWKIGMGFVKVGIAILGIGGGVMVSSNGNGIIFVGLIGVAVLLLPLPFFLLAVITDYMKKRSSEGKDRINDEEI